MKNMAAASGPTEDSQTRSFECNICLDTAKDAVVSMCGHLFCWPCLHQWMETQHPRSECPVCKAAVSKEKVIPLYGRGSSDKKDPRDTVPPRPSGQRTEPEQQSHSFGSIFGARDTGFHMSFGFGAFPLGLGLVGTTFNVGGQPGNPRPGAAGTGLDHGSPEDARLMSNIFLCIAALCILYIFWL